MELTADMHIVLMPGAVIPRYGTGGAACFDIAATEMVNIPPGKTATVSTGLKVAVPKGFELQIRPRSGLSSRGILVQFGTVDEDYRGEIKVIVYNSTVGVYTVMPQTRIAQACLSPVTVAVFVPVLKLEDTARGSGGFGSTGEG